MATKEEISELIVSLKEMEDEIDEFLTDKFADLEIALDERGLKEFPQIFKMWDKASNHQLAIASDLKELRKLFKQLIERVKIIDYGKNKKFKSKEDYFKSKMDDRLRQIAKTKES